MSAQVTSTFGALLRHHRLAAGLTQEELAERARLSARAVIDLERGARLTPRRETVQWLADALALAPTERRAFESAARSRPLPGAPDDPGPSPTPYGGFLGALPASPLVGREVEVGRLLAALDRARAHLFLLAGEPGIGKTRLAQEVMVRAGERGFRVLVGRCYEQYAALPFAPFIEVLTAAYDLASPLLRQEVPRRYAYLGRLLPDLLESPVVTEGQDARLRILWAAGGFLAALAAEAPLALLLDDLHWADSASLELLRHLAGRLQSVRVLLLGTYRDVEVNRHHPLEATLGDLVRDQLVEEVFLRGLPPDDTAALIGAHFDLAEVPAALRDLVHDRTRGNPFFIKEVLKALQEQDGSMSDRHTWERRGAVGIEVPRSIRSVVARRVGRLPDGAQELLRVASVLGQECDLEVLLAASDQEEEVVLAHLDTILAARLLEERRLGRWERYAFSHALIAQALYEEIPGHRLRKLHLRAGEALEQHGRQRPEAAELARHFLAARNERRALPYAIQAGDHAARLYAHDAAIRHYEIALELLEEGGDDQGMARVREKLGIELSFAGRHDEALTVLDRAALSWRAQSDPERLGQTMAAIGWASSVNGAADVGIHRLQATLPEIEAHGATPALAAVVGALAFLYFVTGRYAESLAASERAADLARSLNQVHTLAGAQHNIGNILQMLGKVADARRAVERAITLAEACGDLMVLQGAWSDKAYLYFNCGEFGAAIDAWQRALELSERACGPLSICFQTAVRQLPHFCMGEWDRVRPHFERAAAASRSLGESFVSALLLGFKGTLSCVEGCWEEARHCLEAAVALATRIGDQQSLRMATASLAELDVLEGHAEAARMRLVPLLDRPGLEEFDVTAFLPVLAWAYLELGDQAQAEQTIDQALRRMRAENLRLMLANALRVHAMILIRQARWDAATSALEEGLAVACAMPYPYAKGRLLQVYGQMHTARGEPFPARERLEAALAVFRWLGARKDIEQVAQLLATCG